MKERELNFVNSLNNRVRKRYYCDDSGEINSIPLEENDQVYVINSNQLYQIESINEEEQLSGKITNFGGRNNTKIESLEVGIDPVQDLHGYDSPWPAGGGKQLYNSATFETVTLGKITCTNNGDGSFTLNADEADTSDRYFDIFKNQFSEDYGGTPLPSAQYRLTGTPSGGSFNTYTMYVRPSYSNDMGTGTTFTNSVIGGSILIKAGYRPQNLVFRPMIRLASNGDDTFAPYSNICPISGWSAVNVWRTGGNLFNIRGAEPYNQNVTLTFGDDGLTCKNENAYAVNPFAYSGCTLEVPLGTYTISSPSFPDRNVALYGSDDGTNWAWMANGLTSSVKSRTVQFTKKYVRCNWQVNANETITCPPIQIELGSTPTPYSPYTGNQYTIQLGQTVYGGVLDVTNGVLTVDRAMKVFIGASSEGWGKVSEYNYFATPKISDAINHNATPSDFQSNLFPYGNISNGSSTLGACLIWAAVRVRLADMSISLETWKAQLASTPMQVVYPLATPITIPLTPQEITTLLGTNNLWANTGEIKTLDVSTKGKNIFVLAPPKT